MHYIAFVHTDDTPGFGIGFPDLPGCVTRGDTLDDALRLAREALAFHVEGMAKDGREIPRPGDAGRIGSDPGLLAAIDDAAKARGMNRSAFLASAARKEIAGSW